MLVCRSDDTLHVLLYLTSTSMDFAPCFDIVKQILIPIRYFCSLFLGSTQLMPLQQAY